MKEKSHVGFRLGEVQRLMQKGLCLRAVAGGNDRLVVSHGWILAYLSERETEIICQKDLEKSFRMPKSTVTGILQVMEKNGLINRVEVEGDARSKRIVLTEAGRDFHVKMKGYIDEVEENALLGIDPKKLEIFEEVMGQIKTNILSYNNNFVE